MTNKEMYEFLSKTNKQMYESLIKSDKQTMERIEKCNELFFAFRDRVLKNKEEQ